MEYVLKRRSDVSKSRNSRGTRNMGVITRKNRRANSEVSSGNSERMAIRNRGMLIIIVK